MLANQHRELRISYYDSRGTLISSSLFLCNNNQTIPFQHLKKLIHNNLPRGYKVMNYFVYPQDDNSQELLIAVQERN